MKKIYGLFLFLLLLLSSCSVERRHYRSGFYIDRHQHATAAAEAASPINSYQEEKTDPETVIPEQIIPAYPQDKKRVNAETKIKARISGYVSAEQKIPAVFARSFNEPDTSSQQLPVSGIKAEEARSEIKEALWFNVLNLLLIAPLSAIAYFFYPAILMADVLDSDAYFIFIAPLISIMMAIFALKKIRTTFLAIRTLRDVPYSGGWRMAGAIALVLSTVSFAFGILSLVALVMTPELLILALLSALVLALTALLY